MNKLPTVSIITVCKNEIGRIRETAESVATQRCIDYEWIVIDGGSTDGTLEVLEKYRDRIDVFISAKDDGVYHAMNKGIMHAKGEFCLFMNGGDSFYDFFVIEKFKDVENKCDINYGGIIEIHQNGKRYNKFLNPVQNFRDYLYKQSLPHQGSFIRRELFDRCGLYDVQFKIMADQDFFCRCILKYHATIKHLLNIIAIYHFDGLSAQSKGTDRLNNELKIYRQKYFSVDYLMRRWINIAFSRLIGRPV